MFKLRWFIKNKQINKDYHKNRQSGSAIRVKEKETYMNFLHAGRVKDKVKESYYQGQIDLLKWFVKKTLVIILILGFCGSAYAVSTVRVESMGNGGNNEAIVVGTVATALPSDPLSGRKVLVIVNESDNTIYLGVSGVTTANGLPLYSKQAISIDVSNAITIYGIAAGAGNDIRVMELR